jgi:cellulose synthase operon protein C
LAGATTELGRSLALDPKFVPALYYSASVASGRGNAELATRNLRQIINQDPKSVRAYIRLANIALSNDQEAQAIELITQAIKSAPDSPTPRLALINYQFAQGSHQEALASIDQLLWVFPNNPEALALRGQIQLATGAKSQAIATFRALTALNPQSPSAQVLLGTALNANEDKAGAEAALRNAVRQTPPSSQIRSVAIAFLIAHEKENDALAMARDYSSSFPGVEADLVMADTLIRLKRPQEAEAILTKGLAAYPSPVLALRLSQLAISAGDRQKADKALSNWLVKNPDDSDVRRQRGSLLLSVGDRAGARREFEAVLKLTPEDPIALNNLGWLLQKDDPERSLSMVTLAASIAPRSPEILDTLGWIKFQKRDHVGALPLLQRAHRLNANNPEIGYHLALTLDAAGKRADAKTLLQSVLAKDPKFDDVENAKKVFARW